MMGLSLPHILILAVVVVLLLGGGRFSNLMGDVAKGIKNFKKGMTEEDEQPRPPPRIERPSDARTAAELAAERDAERARDDRL
jgi:sec-independent protein translocase protein TatA